jgi:AcrR family transcriptional regulator
MPRPKSTDTEATRQAIADVAENLFRTVGYHKTTLADIASRLNMSPANIYRFFRSKLEINGVICNRLISDYETNWSGILVPTAPALDNLRRFFVACHRHIRANFLSNQGVYDMIDTAIEQNWPVMLEHIQRMTIFIKEIVRTGVNRGEFQGCDTGNVAALFLLSAQPFLDPRCIARTLRDCAFLNTQEHLEHDLRGVITLLARGLSPQLPPLSW